MCTRGRRETRFIETKIYFRRLKKVEHDEEEEKIISGHQDLVNASWKEFNPLMSTTVPNFYYFPLRMLVNL